MAQLFILQQDMSVIHDEGETADMHEALQTLDKNEEVDFDASLEDNVDFLAKINLDLENGIGTFNSNMYDNYEQDNCHVETWYDLKDITERISDVNIGDDAGRIVHSMFTMMFHKDYIALKDIVSVHEVDVNHIFDSEPYIKKQYQGYRLLHFLCRNGDIEGLETVISLGADPTAKTYDGNTGLHISCRYGHPDVLKYLFKIDNSLKDASNNEGMSPLLEALSNCLRYDKETIYIKSVKMLLEAGCNVNHVSDTYKSPLHVAARKWHNSEVTELLIQSWADVNAVVLGKTALIRGPEL